MKKLVEFDLQDGQFIYAEIDVLESEVGVARATRRSDQILRSTKESLDSAIDIVQFPSGSAGSATPRRVRIALPSRCICSGEKSRLAMGAIWPSSLSMWPR